ncbi:hypothetical protein PMAYCL1PPCAC_04459, partial [Pristionchus mayeri]
SQHEPIWQPQSQTTATRNYEKKNYGSQHEPISQPQSQTTATRNYESPSADRQGALRERGQKQSKIFENEFELQFPIFHKGDRDVTGDKARITINRSHRLITDEDLQNQDYVTFCRYNPLHVLNYTEIDKHERVCIDKKIINQLKDI